MTVPLKINKFNHARDCVIIILQFPVLVKGFMENFLISSFCTKVELFHNAFCTNQSLVIVQQKNKECAKVRYLDAFSFLPYLIILSIKLS